MFYGTHRQAYNSCQEKYIYLWKEERREENKTDNLSFTVNIIYAFQLLAVILSLFVCEKFDKHRDVQNKCHLQ